MMVVVTQSVLMRELLISPRYANHLRSYSENCKSSVEINVLAAIDSSEVGYNDRDMQTA